MSEARRAAEAAARTSYGRLIALLAGRSGDIAAAEDALAEAFAAALVAWPKRGVPDSPDAWLMTAARRSLGHARARRTTAHAGATTVALLSAESEKQNDDAARDPFGDARLKLMFVCSHPAIAIDVQSPLMLQTVLGIDAGRIAQSFLVSPAAMGQRLVRAKTKIRDAGIPFAVPGRDRLTQRTGNVLSAIYAAYGTGWDDFGQASGTLHSLTGEAIWLARLLLELLPEEPEVMGLLSLMLHCEGRAAARRDANGAYVALDLQDVGRWSLALIGEAEALLRRAARSGIPGRFQIEAAIQSLHAQQRLTGENLSAARIDLYDLLMQVAPSTGAAVARAIAHADAGDVGAAQAHLASIDGAARYQPWWAAQARVRWLAGDSAGAQSAAERAAGLSADPAVRAFLLRGGVFRDAAPSA